MKIVLLFMVTIMLFFLYLVPIIWPFTGGPANPESTELAYGFWYIMLLLLTFCWGNIIYNKGCWFFNK